MATNLSTLITFDNNGLKIPDLTIIKNWLILNYQEIFGQDIDYASDTPAGQQINIQAQTILDILEFAQNILSSFDPDQVQGILQDNLYKLNNLKRNVGTYTFQDIQITTDRGVSLLGLDSQANSINITGDVFTVADNNGQQFYLLNTQNPQTAGTYTYTFRAQNIGAITTLPNTITNAITVYIGVIAINNSTSQSNIGENEELDGVFRLRRQNSLAKNAQGYIDSIYANLMNTENVVDARVYENVEDFIDANGIPPRSMYAIVEGGSDLDIATVIANQKSAGCKTFGNISVPIKGAQGIIQNYNFDRPQSKILYIKFDIKTTISGQSFNLTNIKNYIVNNLNYNIGSDAETSSIVYQATNAINQYGGGGVPLNVKISKNNATWGDYLVVDLLKEKWVVSSNNIFITLL